MVICKLNEDGSKKRIFNHIKRLMRNGERKDKSVKVLNGCGITVSDEQEVEEEVEAILGQIVLHKWNVTLGEKKKMIGNGMTSGGKIFSQQRGVLL